MKIFKYYIRGNLLNVTKNACHFVKSSKVCHLNSPLSFEASEHF